MKLREVFQKLNENAGISASADDVSSNDTGATTKKNIKRGNIHDHHEVAIKGLKTIPDWPGYYYNMYRLGVHLAGSPENPNPDQGPFRNEMTFTTFTDVEEKMLAHSAKEMGVKLKALSSNKSTEPKETNVTSPVAKTKRNRYGV